MFVETLEQGRTLVERIGSERFRLQADLCHVYCSEPSPLEALTAVAPFIRYLHVSDARKGYNLKLVEDGEDLGLDSAWDAVLIHFSDSADYLDYMSLPAGSTPFDDEISTYLHSVPALGHDVRERARPIIAYLCGVGSTPIISRRLANTRTGLAHYHEIPGEGILDFEGSLEALARRGFSGHATVELYHHVDRWRIALWESRRQLARFTDPVVSAARCRP